MSRDDGTRIGLAGIVLMALLATGAPAGGQVMDETTSRLQEIHRMVMDPGQRFSISATLSELDGLEQLLPKDTPESVGHGELNYLRGFLHYRAGRPAEALEPMQAALRIDAGTPFLSERERARFTYNLATQAEELRRWDIAIDAYRKAFSAFEADPDVSEDQKGGTLERLAFCLHEAGRFAEARTVNERVLAIGERLFGADSDKLLVVITNLSQNAYKLGEFDASRAFLERRLAIATMRGRGWHIDEALFQLGVLAFERKQNREAEGLMKRRLDAARASGDRQRIAAAEEALAVLHEKLGR